jgi:hypothetical protein
MEEYHVAYKPMQVGVEETLLERLTTSPVPCGIGSTRSNTTTFMKGPIYFETLAAAAYRAAILRLHHNTSKGDSQLHHHHFSFSPSPSSP